MKTGGSGAGGASGLEEGSRKDTPAAMLLPLFSGPRSPRDLRLFSFSNAIYIRLYHFVKVFSLLWGGGGRVYVPNLTS